MNASCARPRRIRINLVWLLYSRKFYSSMQLVYFPNAATLQKVLYSSLSLIMQQLLKVLIYTDWHIVQLVSDGVVDNAEKLLEQVLDGMLSHWLQAYYSVHTSLSTRQPLQILLFELDNVGLENSWLIWSCLLYLYMSYLLSTHLSILDSWNLIVVNVYHSADEDKWNDLLRNGLAYGGGPVQSEEFFKAVDRRIERTLMRTVSKLHFVYCTFTPDIHWTTLR